MDEVIQKSIEQYCSDLKVPEDKREKVLMAVTNLTYERNQNVIALEKINDEEEKKKVVAKITEKDELIKEKITNILEGKEEEIHYDF
ncbi:hypothetical protein KKG41_03095 [Patescibacteria group bacterium]|nr:hypothetical protein [Patescibacteria group bacterium]MBU1890258.1 hypothetical protein [Patescibacteria group bacterium]